MISIHDFARLGKQQYDSYKIAYLPSMAVVSLNQDGKAQLECLVKKGDSVEEGQIIANSDANGTIEYPACVHSPIPGIVEDIFDVTMPNGKNSKTVLIRISGDFTFSGKDKPLGEWESDDPRADYLLRTISDMGIVNTFEEPVSLAQQIKNLKDTTTELTTPPLVVRLFDSEPDLKIESFITEKFLREVLIGASIISQVLRCAYVVFLTDRADFSFPENINITDLFPMKNVDIIKMKVKAYPCASYKIVHKAVNQIIENKYTERFQKILPVCATSCLDVYNAIIKGLPAIDRYVQVQGDAIVQGNIFKVRIGTTFRKLFDECEGFLETPAKIIVNGLVKGTSVADLDTPITRYVKSIFILTSRGFPLQIQSNCIRCGKCFNICSEKIHPEKIYARYINKEPIGHTLTTALTLCNECKLCNTVCPARLPLYQTVKLLKDMKNEEKL